MIRLCADGVESATELMRLFDSATQFVYFSSFLCDLKQPLAGSNRTLLSLFRELSTRRVAMYILYNAETAYCNLPLAEFRQKLPPGAQVRAVQGDGKLPAAAKYVCNNKHYSNHHQKYVCVDGRRFMLGGIDVDSQRTGWLQFGVQNYSWHETSVSVPCTPAMLSFAQNNFFHEVQRSAPFPLVSGGVTEHRLITHLIDSARSCIHMESQVCISAASTDNGVLTAVCARLHRAFQNQNTDRFHFMLLTNEYQIDESPIISWTSGKQLHWSIGHLRAELGRLGITASFIRQRVFIGTMREPGKRGRHIKVHSNMLLQDGHTMLRSSSNFTDRSLSLFPCDNELGILVRGEVVALFQQKIWRRYFGVADQRVVFTPEEAVLHMRREQGVISRFVALPFTLPRTFNTIMALLHSIVFFGGKKKINWKLVY
jgi:phosphatidylserine/phosphatidylglycerophosphate/cardiolipin synthase-like enzyme